MPLKTRTGRAEPLAPWRTGHTRRPPPRPNAHTALEARLIFVGSVAASDFLVSVPVADAHGDPVDSTSAAGAVLDVAPDPVGFVFARVGFRLVTVPRRHAGTFRMVSTDGHVLGDGFSYRVSRNGADPSGPRPKAPTKASASTAPNLMGPGADSSTQGRGALVRAGFLVIGAVLISFVIMATSRRRSR
jgi:hypothetical protein